MAIMSAPTWLPTNDPAVMGIQVEQPVSCQCWLSLLARQEAGAALNHLHRPHDAAKSLESFDNTAAWYPNAFFYGGTSRHKMSKQSPLVQCRTSASYRPMSLPIASAIDNGMASVTKRLCTIAALSGTVNPTLLGTHEPRIWVRK